MRVRFRSRAAVLGLSVLVLAGCGSNTARNSTTGGATGATQGRAGTAAFHVDVATGRVTVTPLDGGGRAVLRGSAAGFVSATLASLPGNSGVRVMSVALRNQSAFNIGRNGAATITGVRLLFSSLSPVTPNLQPASMADVRTVAGNGAATSVDGPALTSATFNMPWAACYAAGGAVYVSDTAGQKIRRVDDGLVTTVAGSGTVGYADGSASTAAFNTPMGLVYSSVDNSLLVCDNVNRRIRRVSLDGRVSTLAGTGASGSQDGLGNVATFVGPAGIALGSSGSTIYVTDNAANKVRRIDFIGTDRADPSHYQVSTLAGSGAAGGADGMGSGASFNEPMGICLSGGSLFVTEYSGYRVRQISLGGAVTTVAGTGTSGTVDGSGEVAQFGKVSGIASTTAGLVVSDASSRKFRLLTRKNGASGLSPTSWYVRTLAGTGANGSADGAGDTATFGQAQMIGSDGAGNVVIADRGANRIRRLAVPTLVGEPGTPTGAASSDPVVLSNADGYYRQGSTLLPYKLLSETLAPGATSSANEWWFKVPSGVNAFEFVVTVQTQTNSVLPLQVGTATAGSADNWMRTLAGKGGLNNGYADGPPAQAMFSSVYNVAVDESGVAYVIDYYNHCVRRIATDGTTSTLVGTPRTSGDSTGTGEQAQLGFPTGIAVAPDGHTLYIADKGNGKLKMARLTGSDPRVGASWTVTTIAGGGVTVPTTSEIDATTAATTGLSGVALDKSGSLYCGDALTGVIYRIRPYNGLTTQWKLSVLTGQAGSGNVDGTLANAKFNQPNFIAVAPNGDLYVTDEFNYSVRLVSPSTNQVSTLWSGDVSNSPDGIAVSDTGEVYVLLGGRRLLCRLDNGALLAVAGQDVQSGTVDGPCDKALFGGCQGGIAIDKSGDVFVPDYGGIRVVERIISGN